MRPDQCSGRRPAIDQRAGGRLEYQTWNHPEGEDQPDAKRTARGVGKQNATMVTSRLVGVFKADDKARAELFRLATL